MTASCWPKSSRLKPLSKVRVYCSLIARPGPPEYHGTPSKVASHAQMGCPGSARLIPYLVKLEHQVVSGIWQKGGAITFPVRTWKSGYQVSWRQEQNYLSMKRLCLEWLKTAGLPDGLRWLWRQSDVSSEGWGQGGRHRQLNKDLIWLSAVWKCLATPLKWRWCVKIHGGSFSESGAISERAK